MCRGFLVIKQLLPLLAGLLFPFTSICENTSGDCKKAISGKENRVSQADEIQNDSYLAQVATSNSIKKPSQPEEVQNDSYLAQVAGNSGTDENDTVQNDEHPAQITKDLKETAPLNKDEL